MLRNPNTQAVGTLAPVAVDGFAAADQHLAMLGKATDIAAQHRRGAPEGARRRRASTTPWRHGGLDGWIAQALQVLDLPQNLAPGVKKIIMAESGGNPHAINLTDSNARRGTPSQGLMQTIPTTFRHYVAPRAGEPADHRPGRQHHRRRQLHGRQLRRHHGGRRRAQQRRRAATSATEGPAARRRPRPRSSTAAERGGSRTGTTRRRRCLRSWCGSSGSASGVSCPQDAVMALCISTLTGTTSSPSPSIWRTRRLRRSQTWRTAAWPRSSSSPSRWTRPTSRRWRNTSTSGRPWWTRRRTRSGPSGSTRCFPPGPRIPA